MAIFLTKREPDKMCQACKVNYYTGKIIMAGATAYKIMGDLDECCFRLSTVEVEGPQCKDTQSDTFVYCLTPDPLPK